MLEPMVLLRDGQAAVGSPWEMHYLTASGYWAKGKQGELPGYRSSVIMSAIKGDIAANARLFALKSCAIV